MKIIPIVLELSAAYLLCRAFSAELMPMHWMVAHCLLDGHLKGILWLPGIIWALTGIPMIVK